MKSASSQLFLGGLVLLFAPVLQPAEAGYIVANTMVSMRDGVRLSTDIYRPASDGRPVDKKLPVLVVRTPYNKTGVRGDATYLTRQGYVVVAQDCRGRFASEGSFYAFVNEGKDGYDTIEWAARQPWSNGKVGTFGASYLAWDQYHAAMYRPPHLVAMFTLVGGANFYDEYAYPGGAPNLGWPLWILHSAQTSPQAAQNQEAAEKIKELFETNPGPWLREQAQKRAEILQGFPDHVRMYNDFYAHPQFDSYWKHRGFYTAGYYREMKDVPMLFLTGWYDYFLPGVLENFVVLSRTEKTPKKLIVGPWPHSTGRAECGDGWFGQDAAIDQRALMKDWFDHWMKGSPLERIGPEPVRIFRMGGGDGSRTASGRLNHGGEWRTAQSWPPAAAHAVKYFLDEGSLSRVPRGKGDASTFVYDPENPVPTIGGRYGIGAWTPNCAQNQICTAKILGCEDSLPLNRRPDVLSFSTKPLESPLEITGDVRVTLSVSSDAPSTDFTAKLMDVYPDGYALILTDGQIRTLPKPDAVYEITIDAGPTSNLFAAGHRIRLDISSSNFPKTEPNPYKAHNTVHYDPTHPSYIEIPIVAQATEQAAATDYSLATVMLPMRDGVKLATDIYRPSRKGKALEGRFPALVARSPYNKDGERNKAVFFARHGYVFVAQDTRGRYASEGHLYPLLNEGRDGYDTIEWVASQSWSNGRVATTGASYLAMDQYAAAIEHPPHLAAIYAAVGGANFYGDSAYRGGAPSLGWPVWLLYSAANSTQAERDPKLKRSLTDLVNNPAPWFALHPQKRSEIFHDFPDQLKAYNDFYDHSTFDAYWRRKAFYPAGYYDRMNDVPMLFVSGWYDKFADGILANFTALSRIQKTPKRVIIGPWPHGYGKPECGAAYFGPVAELKERELELDWFDHWLKGKPFKAVDREPVRFFRMGGGKSDLAPNGKMQPGGEWRTASAWPPPGIQPTKYYIQPDRRLTREAPGTAQPLTFTFDPGNPVPTIGGRHGPACIQNQVCTPQIPFCKDSSPLSERPDVLSFSTLPLGSDTDVTGDIRAQLWISSDATDTDFTAKLIDVYPDGFAMILADGQIRTRYRNGFEKAELMQPGSIYEVTIDLGSTSNLFTRGHRIRLDISSSNYPMFEPNPNTGEPPGHWSRRIKARNTVYLDKQYPSHVVLPIISH